VQHRLSGLAHDDVGVLAQKEECPAGELDELLEEWRLAAAQHVQVRLRKGKLRVRGEIMGSQNSRNVRESQSVIIMINPIIPCTLHP
jgi:phage terminase Nu1 subunit (DNA packaging protein)